MHLAGTLIAFLAIAPGAQPPPSTVTVTPLFWKSQEMPGFVVSCVNASGRTLTIFEHLRGGPIFRLDGRPYGALDPREGMALSGPSVVPAGETYTHVIVLGTATSPQPVALNVGSPVPFGMQSLTSIFHYTVSMAPGEHSISFRCWSDWSPDIRFRWARSGKPPAAEQGLEADRPR